MCALPIIRRTISLLLMLGLMAQGIALAAARSTAHFHEAWLVELDTGHHDSKQRAHQHSGLLSDHRHAPGSPDVVSVDAPDNSAAQGIAKPGLQGLDAPAPVSQALPEAPSLQQQFLSARLAFSSHLVPPPLPPPRCKHRN